MASEWYFTRGGDREGPVNSRQLKALVKSGEIQPDTLVWKQGMRDWTAASSIPGLCTEAGVSGGPPTEPSSPTERDTGASNGRRLPLADRILRTGFAIGRWVSIVIVLLAIVTIAISGFVLSTSLVPGVPPEPMEPETPQFTAFVNECRSQGRTSGGRLANGWMARQESPGTVELGPQGRSRSLSNEPCSEHRVAIRDVLAYLKVSNRDGGPEDQLCDALALFPSDERKWLMDGFVEFAKVWSGAEGRRGACDASEAAGWYLAAARRAILTRDGRFEQRMEEYRMEELERVARQALSAPVLGYSIAGLLVFLIIPLLIQIERNTRVTTES